jgi:formylglycine-generating enzyme required for sulfatase activity
MIPRCGRAQLLRVLAEQGPDALAEAAALSGYEVEPTVGSAAPWVSPLAGIAGGIAASIGASAGGPTAAAQFRAMGPRPKGRFLQVVAASHLNAEPRAQAPGFTAPWEGTDRGDVLGFPETDPLVPWPRLWRRLRPHLSQKLLTREVDLRELLRLVTRADPVRSLPRLVRSRFAARPRILVDRTRRQMPFWSDQDLVCEALSRWMVSNHLRPFCFVEGMDPEGWLKAGAVDFDTGIQGTVILLLGDLGVYGSSSDANAWRRAGQWLRNQGAELRALSPCPAWRLDPELAALWNVVTWDETERTLPPLSEAERQARAERLLVMVSAALRMELGLLREARSLLPPDATDSGTEADILNHPAVSGKSAVALTLDNERQEEMRKAFALEPRSVHEKLVALLERWHKDLPPEILRLEQLDLGQRIANLFASDHVEDLQRFLISALDAIHVIDQTSDREVPIGVLGWFRDLEQRLPDESWQSDELRQPLLRAWAVAHRDEPDPKTPPGFGSEALALLLRGRPLAPRRYRIWQVGDGLLVLPIDDPSGVGPPRPRPGANLVPVGSPIVELTAAAPHLVVAAMDQPGKRYDIPTPLDQLIELPALVDTSQEWIVTSDLQQVTLGIFEKPAWAKRVGRDKYGLYAEFEFKGILQRMRWIAPGKFSMGSPESEPERYEDELQHEVELNEGYWMADTACTQALWEAVMGSNPSHFKNDDDGKSPERPVDTVSREDCQTFLEQLNEQVPGLELRLPTEAQWEYACRAGTATPFSFGENITPEQVNYDGHHPYAGAAKGEYRQKTVPVASLPANAWGLHEMHGNVVEWCADWFAAYESGRAMDPKGPQDGRNRVLRGGCWNGYARVSRSAFRYYDEPGKRYRYFGFRLVRGRNPVPASQASKNEATERHRDGEGTEQEKMPRGRGAWARLFSGKPKKGKK